MSGRISTYDVIEEYRQYKSTNDVMKRGKSQHIKKRVKVMMVAPTSITF